MNTLLTEKRQHALHYLLHVLAVVDALAPVVLAGWWVSTLPDRGGVVGLVVVLVTTLWGLKKLGRALFALEEYPWLALRLLRWALILLLIGLIGKAWFALGA